MLVPLSTFSNTNLAAFPNTEAVDSSGALSTDGTEFIAALVNDYNFGVMQALLDYTGQTPNGTVESPSNSQFLEGMRRAFSYPGEVFPAAFNDDPATLGIRAFKLIGQGITRASYTELDAAVYVGDANNAAAAAAGFGFYHADNSDGTSPNTAGVYLILPDLRGQFIRGLDTPAAIDPDGASRGLGHIQIDSMQGHEHRVFIGSFIGGSNGTYIGSNNNVNTQTATPNPGTTIVSNGSDGTPRTDSETRPTNVAFDYYIRY